jgi:hypothetical protein
LDTNNFGGHLTFEIDGKKLEGVEVKEVFQKLGKEVFPSICLGPVDQAEEENDDDDDEEEKDEEPDEGDEENEKHMLVDASKKLGMNLEVLLEMDEEVPFAHPSPSPPSAPFPLPPSRLHVFVVGRRCTSCWQSSR